MKKLLSLLAILFVFFKGYSQSPGCPRITPVGATICQGQCANLTATAVTNNQTTSYAVSSIAYAPFPYTGGTGVSVGTDDVWSPVVNLGFNFCFFGNSYNRVVLGSNGVLTFDLTKASTGSGYIISTALPSAANSSMPANSIAACFRDIDPSKSGSNVSYYITGSAPCRALVFYFNNVPLYGSASGCSNGPKSKFQLVLYENTNYIDVYIENSTTCAWNSGYGIVGIQNSGPTTAVCPPGRNMGAWTATNEAWRFSPTGAPSYNVTWTGPSGVVGTGMGPISVCPTASTTYTVNMAITNCDGAVTNYSNTTLVTVNNSPTVTIAPTGTLNCSGTTAIPTTVTPASTYAWAGPGIVSGGATGTVNVNAPGVYTVTATAAGCSRTATISMVSPPPITVTANSPAICPGGTAVLTANGASTYTWNPGASTANPYSVSPGSATVYTVIGRSVSGCTGTATSTVSINPIPAATLTFTNPTCGNNNGVININNTSCCAQTISGYASSLGTVSGQTVTGLGAGTPVITLTNSFGCTFTVSTTLTNSPGPTDINITPTNATCGNNNGSFTFGSPTGGTPGYSYAINGGAFSATSPTTNLATGTYSVTVKDANGCLFTKTTSIANVGGPTAIAGTAGPASCAGPTGSYTITGVTGGSPTYSYSIDGGAFGTASVITGLSSGTHSITVKDANGCTFPSTFSVGLTGGITSASVNASTASCGSSNATATVSAVTGGVPTYSYSYDGGAFSTSTTTLGLAAGNHTVVIKDVNTCTLSVPYTVLSLGNPTTSVSGFSNVTCFGLTNGSCTVAIPTGGAGGPFTYSLTAPLQVVGPTSTAGVFNGLPAGSYNISVKDAGGCIATTSVTITQPPVLTLTATSLPAKCFGTATGTISITGAGGTPTYSYNLNAALPYQSSATYTAVGNGIYTMGIKDANNCTASTTVQVNQPTALSINVSAQPANCTSSNGVGSATVTGGTGGYTYTWTPSGGSAATSTGLPGGNYSISATDANGCSINSPVTITITPGGSAAITASANITCNGQNNGSLTAGMVSGGTAPFVYLWNTVPPQSTSTATNLAAGTYTCEITDFYGCKAYASGTVTQPPVLGAIMNSNNVKCFGTATGTVSAAGTGGAGGYTYLWPSLSSTLSTVNNVPVGTGSYNCTITDANGCSLTQSISISEPTAISLTSTVTAANCNQANGSATVTASGGTPAYSYTWSTGATGPVVGPTSAGTPTVDVMDANGCLQTLSATIPNIAGPISTITAQTNVSCNGGTNGSATVSTSGGVGTYSINWSSGPNTPTAGNLSAGIHTVTVTDGAGCVSSASVNITEPTALTVTVTPSNPKCFGASNGSGLAAASGGVTSYTYAWTGAAGNNAQTNPIPAGSYALLVTDANGCTVTSTLTLVDPPLMTTAISSTNVTCYNTCNGVATATTANSVGIVSYYWTGGPSPIALQTASGLCAGTYTVLATDQNNCTASAQVTITQPTQVTANITSSGSVTCNGGTDGFAVVAPGGGIPSYNYSWSGPSGTVPGGTNANNLPAGNYVVTVSDQNTCTATASITITQPAPLSTTLTTTDPKCFNSTDGIGNVAYAGGSGSTTFLWLPGLQSGPSVNNLSAGSQTVTITYNSSCTSSLTFTLANPSQLTAVASATNSNCYQSNGKTCATVAGGIGPYSYMWSNGPTTLCNPTIPAGPYTFTVTDNHGCQAYASGLVNDIAGPTVLVTSSTPVTCFNGNDGAATTTITGGVTPYNISWSLPNGSTSQNVNNFTASPSPYNITVTDDAGCVGTASVLITQPTQVVSAIGSQTNTSCFGYTDGGATMLVNGGISPYSYTWTPSAQTTSVMIGVAAGNYTCNVTDNHGCPTSQTVTIQQPTQMVMTNSVITNITCNGFNNGQIATTVQGGSSIYSYSWTPSQPGNATITNLAPGAYNVNITDSKGCFINTNFTVLEPSVITTSYTSLPAKCGLANGSATVTVNGGTPGSGTPGYTMNWNTAPPQQGTIAINMATGTNWQCVVTDMNGCTATQAVTVTNAPSPTLPTFTVSRPSCAGVQDGSIIIGYTSGTPNYQVSWSAPISVVQTSSALTQSVSNVGAGVYTATLTDSYGCTQINMITVTEPMPLVLNSTPAQAICYGQSAQISASNSGGTPGYTYTWSPALGTTSGPYNVNPTVNSSYTVGIVDANGCTQQKVITVAVSPSLSISASPTVACDGSGVTLQPVMTSPGHGSPYSYTWSNGSTGVSANVLATYAGGAPNQYTVTVSDGCSIPATAIFTITVNPLPIISFTNPAQGCAPLLVTFNAFSDHPGTDTYQWLADKVVIGTSNPLTYTFTQPDSIDVDLVVTNAQGCVKIMTRNDFVIVYPVPNASFYPSPQSASILEPTIYFTNTSQGAVSYDWNFGDPSSGATLNNSTVVNPSHYYDHTGEYYVHLFATSNKGCRDEELIKVEITPDFALYIPNTFTPDGNNVNDIFQPAGVGIDEDNYKMEIFDRWGESIFSSNSFRKGWDGSVKGGKPAPQGVYVYKMMVYDTQGGKHPYVGHVTVIRKDN